MFEFLLPYYPWIKSLHIISVISWMAGLLYLPRLFVYHTERAIVGSDLDLTFQVMESRLLRLIMNPAMIATWLFGFLLIVLGGMDFGAVWSWLKLFSVVVLTGTHFWLAACQKKFSLGQNTRSGRTYRIANEVPTVLMFVIVVMIVVRPF